jgi:hypothetical protein
MDIHQAGSVSTQEEMKAEMDIHQEKMEAAIHSIRSELEETTKHRVEDILLCVGQKTQDLCKEFIEKIDETQVDLQAVKVSIDTWTRSLKGDIMDTRKDFHKAIENTRNDLHEGLDIMFQVEVQTRKAEKINQERMENENEAT